MTKHTQAEKDCNHACHKAQEKMNTPKGHCYHCDPEADWQEEFDEKFVKDHWENKNGVRFDERTLSYLAPTFELESELKQFITKLLQTQRDEIRQNVGMLRQWLNEDRIKDAKRFVTNEQIEDWLFNDSLKKLKALTSNKEGEGTK